MTGPPWLAPGFAVLMLAVAGCCVGRLVMWQRRGRAIELEADILHVFMGVAMAGMLEPRLSPISTAAWRAVFAAGAAWFAGQAIRARLRRRTSSWQCAHPEPHAVECAAMIYMLWPLHTASHGIAMTMPGMGNSAGTSNPAIGLVLFLFMLGYIVWTTDQLAALSRTKAAVTSSPRAGPGISVAVAADSPSASATRSGLPSVTLAPRLAACYKIAMSMAMGYMLVATI